MVFAEYTLHGESGSRDKPQNEKRILREEGATHGRNSNLRYYPPDCVSGSARAQTGLGVVNWCVPTVTMHRSWARAPVGQFEVSMRISVGCEAMRILVGCEAIARQRLGTHTLT